MAYAKIRPRRGTLYEWTAVNPVILEGELVIEVPETGVGTGLSKFKIGDGYTAYDDLPYAFDAEAASAIYGGNVTEYNNIYIRTGTTAEWEAEDPVLGAGEITYDSTAGAIKVGDGSSKWSELDYISGSSSDEDDDSGSTETECLFDGFEYDFGFEDEYKV